MERVTFLLERSDRRISCLLNPDTLTVRRSAGVRRRRSIGGYLTDPAGSDDPLLFTAGGVTELRLELLFDVGLAGSSAETNDVRELTGPLWALSENIEQIDGRYRTPSVRFVWGKAWNVPGVVTDLAERLERFDRGGVPARSWLTMRLLRSVPEQEPDRGPGPVPPTVDPGSLGSDRLRVHETTGTDARAERLDDIASRYYGDPAWWRVIARLNDIDDPHDVGPGTRLRLPPAGEVAGRD